MRDKWIRSAVLIIFVGMSSTRAITQDQNWLSPVPNNCEWQQNVTDILNARDQFGEGHERQTWLLDFIDGDC